MVWRTGDPESPGRGRLRSLAPKVARLSLFLVVVVLGFHLALQRLVRAQVDTSLLALGSGLAQLDLPRDRTGPRVIEVNGASIGLSTETTEDTVDTVLDGAEAACVPSKGRGLRGGDGTRGFIACAVPPATVGPLLAEGRLVEPGYRYVYAEPGSERTLVISVVVDGALDLERLFPKEGDAAGSDAPGIPRPPEARRVLSARETHEAQQVTLYSVARAAPAEIEAWYRTRLPTLGWRPVEGAGRLEWPRVLMVERAGDLAALVFDQQGAEMTSVAILTSL